MAKTQITLVEHYLFFYIAEGFATQKLPNEDGDCKEEIIADFHVI